MPGFGRGPFGRGPFGIGGNIDVLIDLAGAKKQLNKTSTDDDVELQLYVEAAAEWVTRMCGSVLPSTVVETVTATWSGVLLLSTTPVLSVSSAIGPYGASDVTGWSVSAGGVVTPTWGGVRGTYTVTYRVGRNPIPATLKLAARMLVAHLWETQRGGGGAPRPGGYGEVAGVVSGAGFAVPNRVAELVAPYELPPGIA